MRPGGPGDLVLTPLGLRFGGRRFPCALGRAGVGRAKAEGDGATPAGSHRILTVLLRPDRLPRRLWPGAARPIRRRDRWCDDPANPAYNRPVRAPFAASSEALFRPDPLYDLILVTDWNTPATPGRGSAIFLHLWRKPRHPTAGCVALARADLLWIARRLSPRSRLIVPPGLPCHLAGNTPGGAVAGRGGGQSPPGAGGGSMPPPAPPQPGR